MATQSSAVGGLLSSQPSALSTGSFALVAQSSPAPDPDDSTSPRQEVLPIGAFVLLLVGALLLQRAYLRRKARSRRADGQPRPASLAIPCPTCRYFHPNAFLPCAVNPAEVMSQAAASCRDYCPRQTETASRSASEQD